MLKITKVANIKVIGEHDGSLEDEESNFKRNNAIVFMLSQN